MGEIVTLTAEDGHTLAAYLAGRAVRMKIPLADMVKDIRAAVRVLEGAGHKVGVVGYCLGGSLAWLSATRIDGLAGIRTCRCTSIPPATASIATSVEATTSRAPSWHGRGPWSSSSGIWDRRAGPC
jgi:dienelactone hydrolase